MLKFKKLSSVFLVLMFVFLAACSKNTLTQSGEESTPPPATESSTVRVMFREGLTLVEIGQKLEENGVCKAVEFISAAQDINYFKEKFSFLDGIEKGDSAFLLEGFLFPDTYDFYIGEDPKSAVSRFLKNFSAKLTDELKASIEESGLTISEAVTLASIIQAECGFESQMQNVSSVFVNRLNSSSYGKLQSDVTINYVNNFITDSPYLTGDTSVWAEKYNTYKCDGLPCGAVCCPGLSAIKAAVNPASTNYFFFVTDSDMNYYYAETYEEHLKNCEICGINTNGN